MNARLIETAVIAALVAVGCGEKEDAEKAAPPVRATKAESVPSSPIGRMIGDMVAIPGKNFKMGKFEVTQRQWVAVMGNNPSEFKGDDNPVENVSWDDCKEFLKRLNAMPQVESSGLTFRLPTKAEWEFACGAGGTGGHYQLADGSEMTEDALGKIAWYGGNSGETTHPVGQKMPNAFGLYDMLGNVWEWCEDSAPDDGSKRLHLGKCWWDKWDKWWGNMPWGANLAQSRWNSSGFRLAAVSKEIVVGKRTEGVQRTECVQSMIGDMVAIPGRSFKMGKFEVTQAQWEAVMGENPSNFKGADNPVENVSWDDCQTFLKKLNALPSVKESGLVFRLPTEKEWEYACRAGSTGDYCKLAGGTEITKSTLGKVAWYDDNSNEKTHPVGQKWPNAFGLYDMHGNVWEWCGDLHGADASDRVFRGGSWCNTSKYCAAGDRFNRGPDYRNGYLGFRLAAQLPREECVRRIIDNMVAIPGKNYKMGKFEVTQAQWQAVMGDNPSEFKGDDNPVENVSWDDCKKFLEKLNAMPEVRASGLTFRLPTEAEWKYACLAGGTGDYCRLADGSEITPDTIGKVAWYKDNSGAATHVVGQKMPNAFGIYDMNGNVDEWREGFWSSDNQLPVFGGGAWYGDPWNCRASGRGCDGGAPRNNGRGIRLAAQVPRMPCTTHKLFPCLDPDPRAWAWTTEEPAAEWMQPSFDDSAWARACGGFGSKQYDAMTSPHVKVNTDWTTKTIWLRRHFTYAGSSERLLCVTAEMFHDEDAEIYLNGKLVLTVPGWNSDWMPLIIPCEAFTAAVKAGDNVLAVKVKQSDGWQYFDLGLSVDMAK